MQAKLDENRNSTLIGVDSTLYTTPITIAVDPTTHELLTKTSSNSEITVDAKYYTNHLDDYTTSAVTYIGQENKDGTWRIIKIDESGNFPVFTYATLTNNPTLTTYALAWTGRVAAAYNVYSTAF